MDIWRILSAIIRRWYVVTPLLIATVVAAVTIGQWVRPEYKTSAVISVTPSRSSVQARVTQLQAAQLQVTNPYLSLDYASNVLQYTLTAGDVQQVLLAVGLDGTYQVQAVPHSPFIGIDVTANSPQDAMATARGVIDQARRILAKRQGNIDPSVPRVSIDVLKDGDGISVSKSGHLQALAGVLAVGGIVSVIATVLIDDLLLLRRRRREHVGGEVTANVDPTPSSNGTVHSTAAKAPRPITRVNQVNQ